MAFVNLNKKLDQRRGFRQRKNFSTGRKKRKWGKFMVKVVIILVILIVAIYFPVRGIYQSALKLNASSKAVADAAKQENLDLIRSNLKDVSQANKDLQGSLNWLFWVRFIPYFGGFYLDAQHFTKAAEYELDAASTIADSLDPFKNELGFTGTPTPGIDRVSQVVKILDKVVPQLDKIEPDLKKAAQEVSSIDTGKYPETFGDHRVKSRVEAAKNLIGGAGYAVSQARGAIEIAPTALGSSSAKNYLLIFQNDKELRATGGFMTAYAFLKIDKGHLNPPVSDDIYRLDEKLLEACKNVICPLSPPDALIKYLPEANGKPRTAWSLRDSNLSPDVPTSMKQFEKFYSFIPGGEKFDGIVMIDTRVVEELIKITGPIKIGDITYSAETDKRCNCPNVIYQLELYSQVVQKGEADRKEILGSLMQEILAKSLAASTDKLPEFIDAGIKLANSKDILFYMHDQKTQTEVSKLGWTGEIKGFDGDYLHINDSNFAGAKSNLYIEDDVTLEIDTKDAGKTHNKLTINYKNPMPYSTWLNGINRNYVRVYVPKGATLTKSNGSEPKVNTFEELGKTVFDGFLQIRPQNSSKLVLEYELPLGAKDKKYPILIQKQPGTKHFKYEIKINGKTVEKFNLDADKTFNLAI